MAIANVDNEKPESITSSLATFVSPPEEEFQIYFKKITN